LHAVILTGLLFSALGNLGVKGATGRRKKAKLKEEQWILRHLMDTDKELKQVKVSAVSLQPDVQYYRLLSLVALHTTS
jgi:hypothetical protein